jgi:hypothetical protein
LWPLSFSEPKFLTSFGCPTDIIFDSLTVSFGKSFLTCPLQEVQKIIIVRKVKTCIWGKCFFNIKIVFNVLNENGLGVALQ